MTRVLIVAFDGLQPSQVTPELAPNLAAFAEGGVVFANNHPVFPTVTRVNVASLVTGRHPGVHGLAGNSLVVRDYEPHEVIDAMEPQLSKVAENTGDVLLARTLADILHDHGEEFIAVGVGTSGNAYVQNPRAETGGGATIHPEFCLPRSLYGDIIERFGAWPSKASPNLPQMERAVQVLTEYVLAVRDPAVALMWFSEPDSSNHQAGVGSELSNGALAAADEQLGRIIAWLQRNGRLDETDVIVVSDHGYATIQAPIDINAELRAAGFNVGNVPGGVLAAPNGGAVLFYSRDRFEGADIRTIERLTAWLARQPWCGAMLASERIGRIPGTLTADLVGIEGPRSPDLTIGFRWDSELNETGYPGRTASGGGSVGLGTHGGMSRHELHNTLIASGPSFVRSATIDTPTGNVDVAPTILHVLGIDGGESMDGRVLGEALSGDGAPQSVTPRTTEHNAESGDYRQSATITSVGRSVYVDEGNRLPG